MPSKKKYATGDRVVYVGWGGGVGVVVKASKVTALWRKDGDPKDRRDPLSMLRAETAADVAKRKERAALESWLAREPETKSAKSYHSFSYSDASRFPTGAEVPVVYDTAGMRRAADELRLLADWFDSKPSPINNGATYNNGAT